ncbi:MAG: ABC transporter substrate-binding protein [Alphaproteobacteria bacterium]|nr:ABC transporter substrate-binding protein [Alphaproteobacteria bacterium]
MNRTVLIAAGAILAVIAAGVVYLLTATQPKPSITVVSWGGAYLTSQIEAYHKPYMATHEAIITSESYSGGIALVKAQVESGAVTWDVVDFEVADAIRACDEGLLETIDLESLPPGADGKPATEDFLKGSLDPCYVATIVFSHIIAYDKSKFPTDPPTTAAAFFDLATYPGKRGLRRQNPKSTLELALYADGVPANLVPEVLKTPEGLDRAFAKLDTIKQDVVWWQEGAQPVQLLASGQVVMTTAYNGRIFDAVVGEGKPFATIWDGQRFDLDVWGIVKGTKNKALALDFLKFSTDTQRLADQARYIAYAPARASSIKIIEEPGFTHAIKGVRMLEYMPTAPQNAFNSITTDHRWWADHQEEVEARWNAWLAQ